MNTEFLSNIIDRLNRAAERLLDNNNCEVNFQEIKNGVKEKLRIDPNTDLSGNTNPYIVTFYFYHLVNDVTNIVCDTQHKEKNTVNDEFFSIYLDKNL